MSMDVQIFRIQNFELDLSMMRKSYKLPKKTTKIEKFKKSLKMYIIINFETIRYKMTASASINPWILIYKLLRSVSFLCLPKD